MTIGQLKDLILPIDDAYDDFKVILWDYNHQRELEWGGSHSFSKPEKTLCFPVCVTTEDGVNIFDRLKEFCKKQQEDGICKKDK